MWMVVSILSLIVLGCGFYVLRSKAAEYRFKQKIIKEYENLIREKQQDIKFLDIEIEKKEQFSRLQDSSSEKLKRECDALKEKKSNILDDLEKYEQTVTTHKEDLESGIQNIICSFLMKEKVLKSEIQGYESRLRAHISSFKRQEEMNNQVEFYRLQLTKEEISEIERLMEFSYSLRNPNALRKCIYKEYFEKAMNDLLGRVIGTDVNSCVVYKITHIDTQKTYIGQTVNVKDRWRNHLKCGLGIDTPATNKFYKSMMESKPWNFTWEILEKCPKDKLNDVERYWIESYQSNVWGWNSKGGNK